MSRQRLLLGLGWLLTLPGAAILVALAVVATPVFGWIGCRTAGILSIACGSEATHALVEPLWITVLVAASFPFAGGPALLFAIGFAGWRLYRRRRG